MRIRFTQKGFSLIEVVISMAILGILVTALLSATLGTNSNIFGNRVLGHSSCRAEAQSILNNFKSKGLIRNYNMQLTTSPSPAVPSTADQKPSTGDVAANEIGLDFAQRWNPAPYEIVSDTATPTIRPYRLLMGSITTLETIYNNRLSEVCSTGLGLPSTAAGTPLNLLLRHPVGVEDVLPGQTSSGLIEPTAHLRIQAFEANGVGATIPCSPDLYSRPPRGSLNTLEELAVPALPPSPTPPPLGGNSDIPAGMNSAITNHTNYPVSPTLKVAIPDTTSRDDVAWEVTISITHEDKSGQILTCSASERFQYPSMRFDEDKLLAVRGANSNTDYQPLNASVVSTGGVYSYEDAPPAPPADPPLAPYRNCGVTPEANIDIYIRNARPNTIFMCRNLSYQRPIQTGTVIDGSPQKILVNNFAIGSGIIRQSFISDEIIKQHFKAADDGDSNSGDMFVLGLPYTNGTYYCHLDDNCTAIPSFLNMDESMGAFTPNGTSFGTSWDGYFTPNNKNSNDDSVANFWAPCERTFIRCAQNANNPTLVNHYPSLAVFANGSGQTADFYNLRYENLPPGCEVHLQIAEVDAAYNVRATEVREFIQEPLPGNKLCWTGSGVPGRVANQWYFSCDSTPGGGPGNTQEFAGNPNYPACDVANPRSSSTRATYDAYSGTAPCCINFPGDPDNTPAVNDLRNGIWRLSTPPTVRDP